MPADENDPLHELLDDLGGEPSLCSLLGAAAPVKHSAGAGVVGAVAGASLSNLAQTEVCLTLSSKFPLVTVSSSEGGGPDVDRLFVKTKQLEREQMTENNKTVMVRNKLTFTFT